MGLCEGLTVRVAPEIAQVLEVSERTVWRYLRGP
jgi:HTH domain